MLSELVVDGIGVIDRAELHLTPGSSALTGETGAGKTLLVAALGLLRGARADRALVRQGAPRARVEARFVVPASHAAAAHAVDADLAELDGGDVELILAREVAADGRSKARINGRLVTLAVLEQIGSALIDIAGQSEHHSMASAAAQRDALDTFAGAAAIELAGAVRGAVAEASRLGAELETLRASDRDREREIDVLRFEIAEIEAVAPRAGESEELKELAARLEHAEEISSSLTEVAEFLRGESGVGELLAGAIARLDRAAGRDPRLAPLLERLTSADIELRDVADELGRITVAADPSSLATARERSSELARLRRKYGPTDEDVLGYLERSRERLAALDRSAETAESLQERVDAANTEAMTAAEELSALRTTAARELSSRVERLLDDLALSGARFEVGLVPCELYTGGNEKVAFSVAANPGESPRPIAKVASGGELSRIALALRLLTHVGSATTVVFDEVDAGVGGEAARAVGRSLADLGQRRGVQALVVTHLPQVAAFADHQYRVTKNVTDDRTASAVERVQGEERVAELSRMLAGMPDSSRAREHAQELLEVAARDGRG